MKISKVLVVINQGKGHAVKTARQLKQILNKFAVKQEWVDAVEYKQGTYRRLNDLGKSQADLALVCGGDGTLIQTAHRLRGTGIPLLGINIGYLGFITSIPGNQLRTGIRRVLEADYVVSERMALDVNVSLGKRTVRGWALNDVLVSRGANPHVISVAGKIGKKPLTHYRCDGLITSTPTGSTAYSLASGGPIVSPECQVMIVTPICPQALTNRSVVVSGEKPVQMFLENGSGEGIVQVDGMNLCKVKPGETIQVNVSKDVVPIAFLPEVDFFDTLAAKLQWRGQGVATPKYFRP